MKRSAIARALAAYCRVRDGRSVPVAEIVRDEQGAALGIDGILSTPHAPFV